jgi:hypothetical protein
MNKNIHTFIENLESTNPEQFSVVKELYDICNSSSAEWEEKIIYGGIGFFRGKNHFGGIYAYKDHTNLVFSQGYLLKDPYGHLLGKGKFRRHLAFKKPSEISKQIVGFYFQQSLDFLD